MKIFTLVLTTLVFVTLPAYAAPQGACAVSPEIVPMESTYTISVTGLTPNATYGITIRQTGNGSYTKGIGSHPNAGVTTGPDGSGSVELVAHGIETYTDPRLVLNPDAGQVKVHVEPVAEWDANATGQANCSFELSP